MTPRSTLRQSDADAARPSQLPDLALSASGGAPTRTHTARDHARQPRLSAQPRATACESDAGAGWADGPRERVLRPPGRPGSEDAPFAHARRRKPPRRRRPAGCHPATHRRKGPGGPATGGRAAQAGARRLQPPRPSTAPRPGPHAPATRPCIPRIIASTPRRGPHPGSPGPSRAQNVWPGTRRPGAPARPSRRHGRHTNWPNTPAPARKAAGDGDGRAAVPADEPGLPLPDRGQCGNDGPAATKHRTGIDDVAPE
ncbi:hypothetical protein PtB15_9B560 [Puccinia triticina]|nr:hypothetical protein PtB15_9B560 [Puccinia triticina]